LTKPLVGHFETIVKELAENSAVWVIPQIKDKIDTSSIGIDRVIVYPEYPDTQLEQLLVIGGGVLIDQAKVWRIEKSPETSLSVVPSIWGSGAENSPIAVLNEGGKKIIHMGKEYLPDERAIWSTLTQGLDVGLLKDACGDVWAHALEGFTSPLATPETREEAAELIKKLADLKLEQHDEWFEMSAQACRVQSRASVGLVHGIAHVLEPILESSPNKGLGHAKLCTTYLSPTLRFNHDHSEKYRLLFKDFDLQFADILACTEALFSQSTYDILKTELEANWLTIIRDPSSRTNSALVRKSSISYFMEYGSNE
jgi:alcohol dehydrogenase class IV